MKSLNIIKHFKSVLLIAIILSSLTSYAQQCINYKAVIKNNSGNIVDNQNIQLRFTILVLDAGNQEVLIYRETHSPTTDANGIAIACIGEGTQPLGVFEQVEWDRYHHYLKVEVDIGDGFIDLGNTPFTAVPVALNVNGLEKVYGDNTTGWRFKGKDPNNYVLTGDNAVDLSTSFTDADLFGASGNYSFVSGLQTLAAGSNATAMGRLTKAMGDNSFAVGLSAESTGTSAFAAGSSAKATANASVAMGSGTQATGNSSFAIGASTTASGSGATSTGVGTLASGNSSFATGSSTKAESFSSFALGRFNNGGGTINQWLSSDPLFEIGNGTGNSNRSNALTIYKNGLMNINDAYNMPLTDGSAGQVLTSSGNGTTSWSTINTTSAPINIGNYGSNYEPFGAPYNKSRYSKENNRVHLEGLIKASSGGINAGDLLFTLPTGYRPVFTTICLATQTGTSTIRVDIYPNGEVIAFDSSALNYLSLNGITFRVD